MNFLIHYSLLLLIPTTVLLHLIYSPYTKVEESFNIQAIHDIVTYGVPLQDASERLKKHYDHFAFPGAVPRTFIGALSVAGISRPFIGWLSDPEHQQILVRGVVGLANSLSLLAFYDAVSQSLGRVAGYWYILFQASQFHVMYYASRTLPNMYAFALTTLAHRQLLLSNFGPRTKRASRIKTALSLLTISGVIFRSEIALLLLTHVTWLLLTRCKSLGFDSSLRGRLTLLRRIIIPTGIASLILSLTATVTIDTYFWQSPPSQPLWPEWLAFRFNTLQGHASDWGTSPWHFYLTSSLPKLLLNPLTWGLCIPVALYDRLTRRFCIDVLAPLAGFVLLYSMLPHKEWRFVVYVVPGLTAVAAAGAAFISNRAFVAAGGDRRGRKRYVGVDETAAETTAATRSMTGSTTGSTTGSPQSQSQSWKQQQKQEQNQKQKPKHRQKPPPHHKIYKFLTLLLLLSTILTSLSSLMGLYISSLNYPGAHALKVMHSYADADANNNDNNSRSLKLDNKDRSNSNNNSSNTTRPHYHGHPTLLRVHLENLACQTGVTRFLQRRSPALGGSGLELGKGWEEETVWYYDKSSRSETSDGKEGKEGKEGNEGGSKEGKKCKKHKTKEFWQRFDYIIAESAWEDRVSDAHRWDVVGVVEGFAGVGMTREEGDQNRDQDQDRDLLEEGNVDVDADGLGDGDNMEGGKGSVKLQGRESKEKTWNRIWVKLELELERYQKPFEESMKKYVTRGRWVRVKMEPKLWVLRKREI